MKRYRCKKELVLDRYDGDGFYDDSEPCVINVGDIYEYDEDCQERLFIANKPAVHLLLVHDRIHNWIEIYPETLSEFFEEVREG